MKPYERPVSLAKVRMLAPFSYFFLKSAPMRVRAEPVIRFPFSILVTGGMIGRFPGQALPFVEGPNTRRSMTSRAAGNSYAAARSTAAGHNAPARIVRTTHRAT
jgi:hypothetical protein